VASPFGSRWRGAIAVLEEMRRAPGGTRAGLAARLGLSSSSTTEITARLRELALLAEAPAAVTGRGRPTTVLTPHPRGPVVLAVDLRHEDWRCAVAALDGRPELIDASVHASHEPAAVIEDVQRALGRAQARFGHRVRAIGVAVAATVQRGRIVQAASLGWGPVDLSGVAVSPDVPVLIDNDATLAGVAEARYGAAAGAQCALHLMVEVGVGGTLVVDGLPVRGATGAGGEFGHLPFGDPALPCPCGARGCWDPTVDGRALARLLGDPPPSDPRTYALSALARAERDPVVRAAVETVATNLATGLAGLVNALDPDVVTLGGLAEPLRAAAHAPFAAAVADGLMGFRRADPPPVLAAALGADGALHGAAAIALDAVLTANALSTWERLVRS
jgi:predicted NBD/HSP70 family sugar kinase